MAAFVTDSFTDTNGVTLVAHTGELGAAWVKHATAGSTGHPQIQGNELVTTEVAVSENYFANTAPASADYSCSLDYKYNGATDNEIAGPGIRLSSSAQTGYFWIYFRNATAWRLYKYVAGTLTQIGASVAFTPSSGASYRAKLDGAGASLVCSVQRLSDGFWLDSAGTFGASQVNALSASDSAITAAGFSGFWMSSNASGGRGTLNNFSADQVAGPATGVTATGPSTGAVSVASTNFSIGVTPVGGTITGTVIVTPSDGGGGGSFTPSTVNLTTASPTATLTYTPTSTGVKTISFTNNGGLTNPGNITYTVTGGAATAVTMTGPSSGPVSLASSNFTVGANGTITGTIIVTPSSGGGGGTFTPATVSISAGVPTATFTYTPTTTGVKTISATNNGGLSNPANLAYTVTSGGALYNQVNATDTLTGQSIMILVPASGAATPYAGAPTGVIMYVHGSGEDQTGLITDTLKFSCRDALINAGYILCGTNAHGNNWGNQLSIDDYVALEKYIRANYNVKNVALWSQSMGGLDGLSVLAQGKIKLVGWLGTYPVCNLANLYGLGTYAGAINTAFGITGSGNATYANLTYGQDPALKKGFAWRHVPMRFYASTGDTVVPRAQNTDVLAAVVAGSCRESVVVPCTGEHGDPSHFIASEYLAFFDRCFSKPVADGQPATTKTVTLTLTSDGSTPRANLTGLKWSWWDQVTPDLGEYPTDKGVGETTNGSGILVITVKSNLAAADIGWLVVTDSDGTTTQSPASSAYSGPVAVA